MAGGGGVVEASRSVRRRGPGAFEGCRPFAVVVSSGTAVVPSHRLEVDGSAGGGSREEMPEGADLGLPIAPLGTRCFSLHCRCRSTLERTKNRSEPPLLKRPWIRHPVAPQRRAGWGVAAAGPQSSWARCHDPAGGVAWCRRDGLCCLFSTILLLSTLSLARVANIDDAPTECDVCQTSPLVSAITIRTLWSARAT
jgi:hypothetical protein